MQHFFDTFRFRLQKPHGHLKRSCDSPSTGGGLGGGGGVGEQKGVWAGREITERMDGGEAEGERERGGEGARLRDRGGGHTLRTESMPLSLSAHSPPPHSNAWCGMCVCGGVGEGGGGCLPLCGGLLARLKQRQRLHRTVSWMREIYRRVLYIHGHQVHVCVHTHHTHTRYYGCAGSMAVCSTHTHTHTHTCMCVCVRMHVCVCVCVCACVCVFVCVCM
jgi:hypothetical protein